MVDKSVIDNLIGLLDQEARIYDNILKISKDKTNIIVEGKVTELENVVKVEQALVLEIAKLENMREKLVEEISGQIGIKAAEVTITELKKHLSNVQANKLEDYQSKIAGTLGELGNINEVNGKLIKNSLEYIDFSINIIAAAGAQSNNYSNGGQVNDSKRKNFFDVKL